MSFRDRTGDVRDDAHDRREHEGAGNKIEVSLLETAATIMSYFYTYAEQDGEATPRNGSHYPPYAPYGLIETGDGYVYVAAPLAKQWQRLCTAIDRADLVDDPRFATNEDRVANRAETVLGFEDEFADYSTAELLNVLLKANVAAGELQTPADCVEDEHLHARGSLTEVETPDGETVTAIGRTIHFADGGVAMVDQLAALGEHTVDVLRTSGFSDNEIETLLTAGIVDGALNTSS